METILGRRATTVIMVIGLLTLLGCTLFTSSPTAVSDRLTVPPPETTTDRPTSPITATTTAATTATVTASPTTTREVSATPTKTPTRPAATDTVTVPPSATASPTSRPPATFTPSPPPIVPVTPAGPVIDIFRANVDIADPGDTIILEWATSNATTVTLWQLADTGQFSRFWTVDNSGTFTYDIQTFEHNRTTFALSAADAAGNYVMSNVSVTLRCLDGWFFATPPDICPAAAAVFSGGAEQHFENGVMIWVQGEDRIYVLYGDGQSPQWQPYTDEWDPGEPESDPGLQPPPGRYQPVRGFGLVWREQPGVRDRLGWAVDQEMAFSTALQRTSYAKYNETFIRALDGDIWRLRAERSGWEKIPG